MTTIKINYGDITYSMVKTSSKITTPSVKIDGGWIPCFKGDRFAEVTHGDQIYTLSPLMVNGYRMACGSRPAYTTDAYVTASCFLDMKKIIGAVWYNVSINWSFSNSSGATVEVSDTNMYDKNQYAPNTHFFEHGKGSIPFTWTKTFTGIVTVKAENVVLKQQRFSFSVTCSAPYNGDFSSTQKIKIA